MARPGIKLVAFGGMAELLGVTRAMPRNWYRRGLLPKPYCLVDGRPVWLLSDIREWAVRTGRLVENASGALDDSHLT